MTVFSVSTLPDKAKRGERGQDVCMTPPPFIDVTKVVLSQKSHRTPVEKGPEGNFRKQRGCQGIRGAGKVQRESSRGTREERDIDHHSSPKKEPQN